MPLVSILSKLKQAQREGFAVPCFDTFEMMGTQGIVSALENKRAPGIIGLYSGIFDRPYARSIVEMVRAIAQDAAVPISLILDHGADYEHCMQALAYGFTDVMYDGSKLPFEENISTTRLIVRAAHAIGAAVEAELGHVGRGSEYQSFGAQGKGFTEPVAVEEFVAETGVDFLAVAVGNVILMLRSREMICATTWRYPSWMQCMVRPVRLTLPSERLAGPVRVPECGPVTSRRHARAAMVGVR